MPGPAELRDWLVEVDVERWVLEGANSLEAQVVMVAGVAVRGG